MACTLCLHESATQVCFPWCLPCCKTLRLKDFGNRTNFEHCILFVCLFLLLAVCEPRATDPPPETPSMILAIYFMYCICTMFCVILRLDREIEAILEAHIYITSMHKLGGHVLQGIRYSASLSQISTR